MTRYLGSEYVKNARGLLKLLERYRLLEEHKRIEDAIQFASTGNELAFGLLAACTTLAQAPGDLPEGVREMAESLSREIEAVIEASDGDPL